MGNSARAKHDDGVEVLPRMPTIPDSPPVAGPYFGFVMLRVPEPPLGVARRSGLIGTEGVGPPPLRSRWAHRSGWSAVRSQL